MSTSSKRSASDNFGSKLSRVVHASIASARISVLTAKSPTMNEEAKPLAATDHRLPNGGLALLSHVRLHMANELVPTVKNECLGLEV